MLIMIIPSTFTNVKCFYLKFSAWMRFVLEFGGLISTPGLPTLARDLHEVKGAEIG